MLDFEEESWNISTIAQKPLSSLCNDKCNDRNVVRELIISFPNYPKNPVH